MAENYITVEDIINTYMKAPSFNSKMTAVKNLHEQIRNRHYSFYNIMRLIVDIANHVYPEGEELKKYDIKSIIFGLYVVNNGIMREHREYDVNKTIRIVAYQAASLDVGDIWLCTMPDLMLVTRLSTTLVEILFNDTDATRTTICTNTS